MSDAVAVVDLGSNSTNLLIADAQGRELQRVVAVTGMATGDLTRVEHQLGVYARLMDDCGVPAVRRQVVATAAARRMSDTARNHLFDLAEHHVGARPRLLSGHDEGRLAFAGAVHALGSGTGSGDKPWLVVDIGGASTELMWGQHTPEHVLSLDLGAVTLTTDELHGDPPRPEELSNAVGAAADAVADAIRAWPVDPTDVTMVGIAGTVVTAAAVEIGLAHFDAEVLHGFVLTRAAAEDVFRTLATERLADRVHNPGLPADRAEVIVGGLCILVAVMRTLRAPELVVSVHNLLDGVVAEVLAADR